MAAQAQRVGLDQPRPARPADLLDGRGESLERGGHVGRAIEGRTFNAVTGGAVPEFGAGGVLLADRRGVGITVVLDDEQDRQVQQRGQIE